MIAGSGTKGVPGSGGAALAVRLSGSLSVLVMLPESLPAEVGVNDRSNLAVLSGAIVLGVVTPETSKRPPPPGILKIFRFAPPVLVEVNESLTVLPTFSLLGFRLAQLARGQRRANVPVAFPVGLALNQSRKLLH